MVQSDAPDAPTTPDSSANGDKKQKKSRKRRHNNDRHTSENGTPNGSSAHAQRRSSSYAARRSSLSKPGRDMRDEPETKRQKKDKARQATASQTKPDAAATSSTRSNSPVIDFDGLSRPSLGTRERLEESPEKQAERLERMKGAARTLLECVGENPDREGLLATPERYAKAMLFFTRGYEENVRDIVGALRMTRPSYCTPAEAH